ncbi:tetratricopeptide repeat protein [Xanthomarina sp. F1114]|uniref:tetratricopeptide repeat-containing sensor histidine kinase n=1 Tax=Xanthomarina sp. F1114 TaxID=2996019 RepID=UPI00225E4EC9|nr:tetratricopeptide repeat protein [Xanthomarina sp. F1114]MCX7549033.1 tetratricopeptide repeat protein [Xanthomarina sp. F1114]
MAFPLKILLIVACLFFSYSYATVGKPLQEAVDSSEYYHNKVIKPASKSDLLQAFVYYRNRKDESLKASDTIKAIYSFRQIAIIQNKLGILYDSETTAIEALNLIEKLPLNKVTRESKVGIYNHLGRIYREMYDYRNAVLYYQKALDLAESKLQDLVLRNNIAYVHLKQDSLQLALQEFTAIYADSKIYKDSVIIARSLNNLGIVKGKLEDESAIKDLNAALEIRLALGHTSNILGSYYTLSKHYKRTGDIAQAKAFANKAYNLAKLSNNSNQLTHVLSLLVDLKADPEVSTYKKLMDSIQKSNLLEEGKYASKKYALEKQERLADERLLLIEKEKNQKLFYVFLSVLLIILAFVIFFYLDYRHKKQKQLEVYHTELRISKKVHDEVANEVYHIMTKIQHPEQDNRAVLDDLEVVYNRTRDISREHHDINVNEDYKELLLDLVMHYKTDEVHIITKDMSKVDWPKISRNKKIAIYRVIQELLINMKKHSQASIVLLSFQQHQHKIQITYKDNGVGCEIKKQNGLQNTENRIQTLNGSITFKSEKDHGFHVLIKV